MDLAPIKRWIGRRAGKQSKEVTSNYTQALRRAIDEDTRGRLARAKSGPSIVQISDDATALDGISIARSSLAGARLGDDVVLTQLDTANECERPLRVHGHVLRLTHELLKIRFSQKLRLGAKNADPSRRFRLELGASSILDRRRKIQRSIARVASSNRSPAIREFLLGSYSDQTNQRHGRARVVELNGLNGLRWNQLLAAKNSLSNRISLVEGVAGSGKTRVAANIACSASRLRRCKVLLCSPVQSTVDRLAQLLLKVDGIRMVQLTDESLRHDDGCRHRGVEPRRPFGCSLEERVAESIYELGRANFRRSAPRARGRAHENLQHKQGVHLLRIASTYLRRKVERKILRNADVVCCTLLQAGYSALAGAKFEMLIVDDAQVASEAECLVPLMLNGIKQVTLLSDVRKDILLSRSASAANGGEVAGKSRTDAFMDLWSSENSSSSESASIVAHKSSGRKLLVSKRRQELSKGAKRRNDITTDIDYLAPGGLFERWISMGLATVALRHQFRMHETLAAFPNHHFYLSRLKTDPDVNSRKARVIRTELLADPRNFGWLPKRECLTAIFDISSSGRSIGGGVAEILRRLMIDEKIPRTRIGLIANTTSPSIESLNRVDTFEPALVDRFIGQERDFVILLGADDSSTEPDENDFMANDNALHIALSRARLGLFVVADLRSLPQDSNGGWSSALSTKEQDQNRCCKSWLKLVDYYRKNKLVASL